MHISRLAKIFALYIMRLFSIINIVIPKKDNTILFFSNNYNFNDNNKALLQLMLDRGYNNKYKIYVSTPDPIKEKNSVKNVTHIPTLLAPFIFLNAKFCFYDGGTLKIKPSKSQMVISLWHGIPLKKIGILANEQLTALDRYDDFTKIIVPHSSLSQIFEDSFGCSKDKILINGYPKNDHLFIKNPLVWQLMSRQQGDYKKSILWMPTFRRSINGRYSDGVSSDDELDLPILKSIDDIVKLNSFLKNLSLLFVIKLHPYSSLNNELVNLPNLSNISLVRNDDLNSTKIINYQFVNAFDGLLTDYSSIYFDYLLLDKPIGFTIDDIEKYENTRGFNFPNPLALMPGSKISTYNELCHYLSTFMQPDEDEYKKFRNQIRNQFHEYHHGNATESLLNFIKLKK
ncbi:MAG: CDP-glycerol glycerophosphotransferase family protein [Neisseriaceae bacterium]|nr:CDP-glycerol glycerophosphotransferase family protein [Neisseriaceae bacterium]